MTIKKQHTIFKVTPEDGPYIDQNFDSLYKNKLEARFHNNSGTTVVNAYQSIHTGTLLMTPTSTSTVSQITTVISYAEKLGSPQVAVAQCLSPNRSWRATVTDITQTALTIVIVPTGGLGVMNSSGCSISVNYFVLGANP
jgi:hypothetical protein